MLNNQPNNNELVQRYASHWLRISISAVGLSALLAMLLVLSRTPVVQQWLGLEAKFHTALVLHVNFSVLIWLLTFGATIWSMQLKRPHPLLDSLSISLVISGALLMLLTPFMVTTSAVMSNYIPVLNHPLFLVGLGAFALGIIIINLRLLNQQWHVRGVVVNASRTLLLTLTVFVITLLQLKGPLDAGQFEILFWGGGHLMQFVYLLLMQYAWFKLMRLDEKTNSSLLDNLVLLPPLAGVLISVLYAPASDDYRQAFTLLMQYGSPLVLIPSVVRLSHKSVLRKMTLPVSLSLALMAVGIVLGIMISGNNVMVTAHYHATNAAISITFMALAYHLYSKFGLGEPSQRWQHLQLKLYGIGMLLYIGGMGWSGWLNIPRKSPITITELPETIAMGIMGFGGLIAVVATLTFFLINIAAPTGSQKKSPQPIEQHFNEAA